MFVRPDLILLHAPSVYDFRKRTILYGPIADVIPSLPVYEMYPVGFTTIAEYLLTLGLETRVVNLAYRMLASPRFDAEAFIAKLRPRLAFGVDLHWLPHAHGAVEIARLVKKHHPHLPVIVGGWASTYFHEELIELDCFDYVFRGDSTEMPVGMLMRALAQRDASEQRLSEIPNLTWKDRRGATRVNALTNAPTVLDRWGNNYLNMFKMSMKFASIGSQIPFHDWWTYPITAIMTNKGCNERCAICGGAGPAVKEYAGRECTAFRPPELIVRDAARLARYTNGPLFFIGDLNQAGPQYAHTILDGLRRHDIRNNTIFELFDAAPAEYFRRIADSVPNFNFEMSPETHDDAVRKRGGKKYTSAQVVEMIGHALGNGAGKFDIYFMIGLPGQTPASVMDTVEWAGELMDRFDKRLFTFISPLAPFLDPGSLAFEHPDAYGYKILFKKFADYRAAISAPTWKQGLNYETQWLTRDELVDVTYRAGRRLNQLKHEKGFIDEATYRYVDERIGRAIDLMARFDKLLACGDPERIARERAMLKAEADAASTDTVNAPHEIKWKVLGTNFNYIATARDMLLGPKF
ncbi:MAG TPA: TIGR04190 family B12-binding domain/radical SAM domain protein [bacterium]|nr:TIGR04190 family B12-binding domain/radical SAM domain protein [bacterium]